MMAQISITTPPRSRRNSRTPMPSASAYNPLANNKRIVDMLQSNNFPAITIVHHA
jgi:hypothetical protein